MDKNYENALKVIDAATVCSENKDFAADIVRALAGEVKPEPETFQIGDIVEVVGNKDQKPLVGKRGIVLGLRLISRRAAVEFFENIDGHDCVLGTWPGVRARDGHGYFLGCENLHLIHRPSLNITAKA